jgi:hypothetical protein
VNLTPRECNACASPYKAIIRPRKSRGTSRFPRIKTSSFRASGKARHFQPREAIRQFIQWDALRSDERHPTHLWAPQ